VGLVPAMTRMSEKPAFQAMTASTQSSYQKTNYRDWTTMNLSRALSAASAWVVMVLVVEEQAVPHEWQAWCQLPWHSSCAGTTQQYHR